MTDNVAITAGSGTTIAADDIGAGVLAQRVKPVWGPDGIGNDTDVASGKPLPVQLRASTGQTLSDTTGLLISTTQLSTLGQTTASASQPVVIASDQSAVAVKAALNALVDGADVTFGAKADAKSTATDTTAITAMQVLKQISASVQAPPSQAVTNAGTFAVQSAVAGDITHDSVDSGNPVKQGFKATTALSGLTLVSSADRTDAFAGVDGVQIVRPHCNLEDIVSGNSTNTDGTSTQCIAAQSAGIKTYLTSIVLCNTSATAITVDIKDGSTVKTSLPLPAGSGCIYNPPVPIPGTAATAWNFDGSAAATTVTCSMIGFKSKI